MFQVLLVALGGAVGSVFRFLVGEATLRLVGHGFPWGTLIVNIVGSFLIGVFAELIVIKFDGSVQVRLFLITGILGGFTTFSAFSLETAALMENGSGLSALGYLALSVGFSLAAVFAGLALMRALV
ncbi:fluoride efflux transporter CrcB [Rhizobiaceae bacterium n13]|uniref:Fluoride-specific ion channel FluC n=1 Tax=Ferirhizobium litorale TaxID=2927786 RepID=A0AAE3QGL8_9HYPH|nr:fluoride efflux transporter CrcB [Fererhizobium litorale]MDI7863265.1 fluoride efflux transporter CrcB [Fererhizobium litorale]MDI7923001.1 fluoride efflux transporter CrcB [Fererhizobium litorale]